MDGIDALSHAELLSILLGSGVKGHPVKAISEDLILHHGSLNQMACADIPQLCQTRGIGVDKAMIIKAAFALAKRLVEERPPKRRLLERPEQVAQHLRERVRFEEVECLYVILLNARHQHIKTEEVSRGILDAVMGHPREVFQHAIRHRAAALVLAHNHPSGDPMPSESDIRLTREMFRAGQILKIELLDHVILGRPGKGSSPHFVSLREQGYFYH